jgi:hypothetical protein
MSRFERRIKHEDGLKGQTIKVLDQAEAIRAAKVAIEAVLIKISSDADYARLFPAECEEFTLLTYALARLWDRPLAQVREKYFPGFPPAKESEGA